MNSNKQFSIGILVAVLVLIGVAAYMFVYKSVPATPTDTSSGKSVVAPKVNTNADALIYGASTSDTSQDTPTK